VAEFALKMSSGSATDVRCRTGTERRARRVLDRPMQIMVSEPLRSLRTYRGFGKVAATRQRTFIGAPKSLSCERCRTDLRLRSSKRRRTACRLSLRNFVARSWRTASTELFSMNRVQRPSQPRFAIASRVRTGVVLVNCQLVFKRMAVQGSPLHSLSPFGRDGRASASEGKGVGEGRGGG
jgi:hypothetical protein